MDIWFFIRKRVLDDDGDVKLKSIVIGTLMIATILSVNAVIIFNVTQSRMQELNIQFDVVKQEYASDTKQSQSLMQELNIQFDEIMTETLDFLDHAWDVAKKFQDPNYDYDPSELGNYTTPENHTATASSKHVLCD